VLGVRVLEVLVTVMLATFVGESFCERLVARLGLRELRAQGVDVVVVRRSGGFRGLRRRRIVQRLDSLVHGLLLVVCEQLGEVGAGNGQSCQYTVAVACDATLVIKKAERLTISSGNIFEPAILTAVAQGLERPL
jgi:hypothetical protein